MITLVGYMGCGKSTIGKALARELNFEFIDLDDLIVEKMGASITELFEEHGEKAFRTIEINILQYAVMKGEERAVLSTGGGTPSQNGVMKYINQVSTSFYLQTDVEELVNRLKNTKSTRPLIADKDDTQLQSFVKTHLEKRAPFYKKANFTIDNVSIEKSISQILTHYQAG